MHDEAQPSSRARRLRRERTSAERLLWSRLRGRKVGGEKFRRQTPIADFIGDFVTLEGKLVVELDGAAHGPAALARDAKRTAVLGALGYDVVRFQNEEVYRNLEGVCDTILNHLHLIERGHRLDAS